MQDATSAGVRCCLFDDRGSWRRLLQIETARARRRDRRQGAHRPRFLADTGHSTAPPALRCYACSRKSHRQMRDVAKMVNFGIAYGMANSGSAAAPACRRRGRNVISRLLRQLPGHCRVADSVRSPSRTKTATRRRSTGAGANLPAIRSTNFQVRSAGRTEGAHECLIQGTRRTSSAQAWITVDRASLAGSFRSRMICRYRDELIFGVPAPMRWEAIRELQAHHARCLVMRCRPR